MVRHRRALALMGRFISHKGAAREARLGGAESLAGSVRLAQYHSGRRRFPAATPQAIDPFSPRRQNASRCAAKNDIQPTGQGRNAPGLRRGFLLRALIFILAEERRRVEPSLRCGSAVNERRIE